MKRPKQAKITRNRLGCHAEPVSPLKHSKERPGMSRNDRWWSRGTEVHPRLGYSGRLLSRNVTWNRKEAWRSDLESVAGTGTLYRSVQHLENCTARAPKLHRA